MAIPALSITYDDNDMDTIHFMLQAASHGGFKQQIFRKINIWFDICGGYTNGDICGTCIDLVGLSL